MAQTFQPESHFFVDHNNLTNPLPANLEHDAFGPLSVDPVNKYRITSFIRAATLTKVFAICDGQIMIQPQAGDPTKVNLILKPAASYIYDPIKIKYFIYRGVRKQDLIGNNVLVDVNLSDPTQPIFLQKLWKEFVDFNLPFYEEGVIDTPPETFPALLIGYDETQSGNTLIEHYFKRNNNGENLDFYQIPACKKGEFLGNFTDRIGLDVVLDYGDYELTNHDELFKLNLDYARKTEHIFDISTLLNATPEKIKRYQEHINQFLDAAAFWGSHIECGEITSTSVPNKMTTNEQIFLNILNKYQTKSKIYIYVQGERVRSYNYFDPARKIYGFNSAGEIHQTSGWPILIREIYVPAPVVTFKEIKNLQLEYSINSTIPETDRQIIIDVIAPNNDVSIYPKVQRPINPAGVPVPPIISNKTDQIKISFPVNGTRSCSIFIFLFGNLKQEVPIKKYFNELWPVNLDTTFSLPSNANNLVYWLTYDRHILANLDDTLQIGAVVENKIVFDNGIITDVGGPNPPTKKRRTYVAGIKSNTNQNSEYNTAPFTSGFEKQIPNIELYSFYLFNDINFFVYKGQFEDNLTLDVINSLSLSHHDNYRNSCTYLYLGITEEEFNKLVYDSPIVPIVSPPLLPLDSENVFFYLEEVVGFATPNVKKFKLGLQYENNVGIVEILYPSVGNSVYIYTVDGVLFCSHEYATYQPYYHDYPKSKVEFRVTPPYAGEFGFDWMRIGDTGALGDVNYKNNVGKVYTDPSYTTIELDTNSYTGDFLPKIELFKKLEIEYKPFPTQFTLSNIIEKYYVPILTIYPTYIAPPPPIPDLDRQSIFTPPYDDDVNRLAKLTLKIEVTSEPVKLEFDYDTTIFSISPTNIPKTAGSHTLDILLRCLTEFGTEQSIKVKAFYNDSSGTLDPIGKMVGILRVKPNSKSLRYSKKLLLVNVRTDIEGAGSPPLFIFSIEEQAKFLKKFVRQVLSTPIMETITIDLIANPDPIFNSDFIGTGATGSKFLKEQNTAGLYIIQYLYNYLTTTGPAPVGTAYDNYFKVFFFNDNGIAGRFGFSLSQINLLADFTNNLPSTTSHEFLHTANLQHTFANYEGSKYAKFTYKPVTTDNIMDYSDFAGTPIVPTISLYDWQGEVTKEKFENEP